MVPAPRFRTNDGRCGPGAWRDPKSNSQRRGVLLLLLGMATTPKLKDAANVAVGRDWKAQEDNRDRSEHVDTDRDHKGGIARIVRASTRARRRGDGRTVHVDGHSRIAPTKTSARWSRVSTVSTFRLIVPHSQRCETINGSYRDVTADPPEREKIRKKQSAFAFSARQWHRYSACGEYRRD